MTTYTLSVNLSHTSSSPGVYYEDWNNWNDTQVDSLVVPELSDPNSVVLYYIENDDYSLDFDNYGYQWPPGGYGTYSFNYNTTLTKVGTTLTLTGYLLSNVLGGSSIASLCATAKIIVFTSVS